MGYFSPLRVIHVTQLTINQTTTIRFARIIPQTPVSVLLSLAILYLPKQFIIYVSNTKYEENENLNSRIIMGLFVPTAASVISHNFVTAEFKFRLSKAMYFSIFSFTIATAFSTSLRDFCPTTYH